MTCYLCSRTTVTYLSIIYWQGGLANGQGQACPASDWLVRPQTGR
jgi:hypothetical protein